jgi:ABC-type multidrug transport system ATPase subunit
LQEYGYSLVLYALHFSFQPSNQAFIILDKGKVVAFGNLEELREQTGLKDQTLDDIYIHVTQGGQTT